MEDVEGFYDSLNWTLKMIPTREFTIIMRNFNAKVGKTKDDYHHLRIFVKHGIGDRTAMIGMSAYSSSVAEKILALMSTNVRSEKKN